MSLDRRPAAAARSGVPLGRLDAGRLHAVGELATDRHLDAEQVEPGPGQGGGLVERGIDIGFGERRPDPRPRRLAEQVEQLAPGDPVGVDALDRDADQPLGLGDRDLAAIRLAQQLRLEGQVDRAGGDVERQLLGVEVVFGQRHRERQGDAAAEPVPGAGQPAVDRRAGQRPPRPIEPADAEQAQQRSLLAERGRGSSARAPRAGEGLGPLRQPIDRAVSH